MLQILFANIRLLLSELNNNKLRTFLSLLGITFGIFSIVSVMAVVGSLKSNVTKELEAIGGNTIFIEKWEWGGGSDYPWWKFVNRPDPSIAEFRFIKNTVKNATGVTKVCEYRNKTVEYENSSLSGVQFYTLSQDFVQIKPVEIFSGRFFSTAEFANTNKITVIGDEVATSLFGSAELAIGKEIRIEQNQFIIVGVMKKYGKSLFDFWEMDKSCLIPYRLGPILFNENRANRNYLAVKGNGNVSADDLKWELKGAMRSIRRLSPKQEDNFALNDISSSTQQVDNITSFLTIGGIAITILSFIVGIFGVANIMFVTVRERTNIIGLKKAIGAKRRTILSEFLMESAFLCVLGGIIGLLLVFLLTFFLTYVLKFQVTISWGLFFGAVTTCILTGILAGVIPAFIAAKMDPVVAIRSK